MTSPQSNLLLIKSAKLGNQLQVTTALERGADIDTTDAQGTTALMFAAQKGLTQTVDLLIAAGADLNLHRRQFGTTALMFAAAANRIDVVSQLLAQGVNVNASNEDGSTALMGATLAGAKEIVALLLMAGANVLKIDADGDNALSIAISGNYPSIVQQLLAAGADPNVVDPDGDSLSYELTIPSKDVNTPVDGYFSPDASKFYSTN